MDNYNNGQIPPWQNNNSGIPPYYTPPTRHPGSSFATASMVLGILAILSAFTGTVFPPVIFGCLSIILALLSKGNDRAMLPNAKVGVLTGILGLIVNILIVASSFLLLFTNPNISTAKASTRPGMKYRISTAKISNALYQKERKQYGKTCNLG